MAQVVRNIKFNNKPERKEKMIKSISFKENERELWDHLTSQLNAAYYIKYLILKDMQELEGEFQTSNVEKNKIQNSNSNANSNDDNYLNLDF